MIIIMIIAGIANLFLGVMVWTRKPKNILNVSFGLFAIAASLLNLFDFLFRISLNEIYLKVAYSVAALIPALAALWVPIFCKLNKNLFPRYLKFLLFATGIIFSFSSYFDGWIFQELEYLTPFGFKVVNGILFPLYSTYIGFYTALLLVLIFLAYRKAQSLNKVQLFYVFLGILLYGSVAVITTLILPIFNIYTFTSFDAPSSIFFVGFTAYAITRYRLMDIRAILFRTMTFGFILLLITSVFAVTATIIASLFAEITDVQSNILAGLIIAVLVTTLYIPARNLLEKLTNSVLYKRAYDSDVLLSKMNEVTSSILDYKKLLQTISDLLQDAFNSDKIGVALLNEKGKLRVAYQKGFLPGIPEMLVTFPGVTRIMFKQFQETPGVFVIDERKTQYENGEFKPVSPKMLNLLDAQDLALIVPLYSKENLIGVLVMGDKKSGDPYSSRDINILTIMSGQIAVAFDRARLYAHLEELVEERTEELHEANTKLESANVQLKKLDAAKSEFISIASHQLRSPLTAIKGYISMMQEGDFGKVPQNLIRYLDIVFNSNERLIALVNDLLNISRIESGRQKYDFRLNDIVKIAEGIIMDIKPKADEKKLALILEKPKDPLPQVFCDGEKIHEVMMNFIDNAIKYTKKGNVTVRLEAKPKGMVIFSVKDTGMGITKENMPLLFKKFSRGEGSFLVHTEGTGLGLYVAKMIVEIHEGKTWAESLGPDKGSTFSFSIPISGPKKLPQQTPDAKE